MSKYDKFWEANEASGNVVGVTREKFGKWGEFQVDNADVILLTNKLEKTSPELIAVTWMNESTFRFYVEPNKNNFPDDFSKWDVGPMQVNVGYTQKDISVGFFSAIGLDMEYALGSPLGTPLFNGNPLENIRLGARKLNALGRAAVIGKNKVELFPKVPSIQVWKSLDTYTQNVRRAALYTRPDARDARIASFNKFGPMFQKFFEVYAKE